MSDIVKVTVYDPKTAVAAVASYATTATTEAEAAEASAEAAAASATTATEQATIATTEATTATEQAVIATTKAEAAAASASEAAATDLGTALTEMEESTGYGIISGGVVTAQSTPDMTVAISACTAHMASGKRYEVDAVSSQTITAADSTKTRIDLIYLDSSGNVTYEAGTLGTAGVAGARTYTVTSNFQVAVAGAATYTLTTNFVSGDTVRFEGATFAATTATQDSTDFIVGSDIATSMTNLATALNANTTITDFYTVTVSSGTITLTETGAGSGRNSANMVITGTGVISRSTIATSTAPDVLLIGGTTLTATSGTTDSTDFAVASTIVATVTNIAAALSANSTVTNFYTVTSSDATFTLTETDAGHNSTPLVASVTNNTGTGTGAVTSGTATTSTATTATAPSLPSGALSLAKVEVVAGATTITTKRITDTRIIKPNYSELGIFNVKDYGANGTWGDDTAAIQKAINAAILNGGGCVFFPSGVYGVSSPIILNSNPSYTSVAKISFVGVNNGLGSGSSILYALSTFSDSEEPILDCRHAKYTGVYYLRLLGNSRASGIEFGERSDYHKRLWNGNTVASCYINGCYIGIKTQNAGGNDITRNIVCNSSYVGIYLGVSSGDSTLDTNWVNTSYQSYEGTDFYTGAGIVINSYTGNTNIIGGKVEWNAKGIVLHNAYGINISNINFDVNYYGHIIVVGGSAICSFNINDNRFLSGGSKTCDYFGGSHIYVTQMLKNTVYTRGTICGNSFKYAGTGAVETDTTSPVGPTLAGVILKAAQSAVKIEVVASGNDMINCAGTYSFYLDNFDSDSKLILHDYGNSTNLDNYITGITSGARIYKSSYGSGNHVVYGTAAPTNTTGIAWALNDEVINTSPAIGSFEKWKCISAGTPGTWKGINLIEPSGYSALSASSPITVDFTKAKVYTLTPTSATSLIASGGFNGQSAKLIITTSGTTTYILTFSTNFKTTGTLATGTTSGAVYVIDLICYNGTWYEVSRTTAM